MNSFPKPQNQFQDNCTFNPESKNEPYSPENHCILLQKDKARSVYQQLNTRHPGSRDLPNAQAQARRKAYSCANHNSKESQDKKNMQNRNDNDKSVDYRSLSKRKRRQKVCRSAENRQVSIPLEEQEKLFHRITIHCLKAKRQAVEYNSKEVESQYSFVLKKIAHLKRNRQLEQFKQKKISIIKQENRKMSEEMQKNYLSAESRKKQLKEELRNHIMAHRSCRKQIVLKKMQENIHSASEQRLFSKQLHDRIQENFQHSYQRKRLQCQKERKQYEKRQLLKSKKLEAKKMQARKQFRNRWFHELQLAEHAEKELFKKQAEVKEKMSQAIESYNQLLNKH